MSRSPLDDANLDVLFRAARTHHDYDPAPLPSDTLRAVYELTKFGPTSANCSPARFVFVTSDAGKARLAPHLSSGNHDKTMKAPVCVIIAWDSQFLEFLPKLFPPKDMRPIFESRPGVAEEAARRNATLQGAYFMIAARALGLDCGPMSGYNPAGIDTEFFPDRRWRSEFLCNLGFALDTPRPRLPRLRFEEACRIV